MSTSNDGRPHLTNEEHHRRADLDSHDLMYRPLSPSEQHRLHHANQGLSSPCFIHSRLDNVLESSRKDASYFDGHSSSTHGPGISRPQRADSVDTVSAGQLNRGANSHGKNRPEPRHRGAQGAVEPESGSEGDDDEEESNASTSRNGSSRQYSDDSQGSEDEDDRVRSLTRQLAETAVGVREMSKQLGRARVKSTIQSVLIITKARDNHLIKLTRELAIWLMDTPRNGKDRGLVVYVDAQLRQSKRFDAEGIRRDYPHLFAPFSMRQQQSSPDAEADLNGRPHSQSSSTSSSRMSGSMSASRDESQLRYWTSDMCSRSPHLFDFVVTLGGDGTVLFCSWLFQRIVPPVMPFALGSLGFLTNFDFSDYQKALKSALDTGIRVNLRMRFTATVYRATLPLSSTIDRRRRRAIRSGKTGEIIMRNIQEGGWNRIETPLPSQGDLRGAFTEASTAMDGSADRPAPDTPPPDTQQGERAGKKDKEVMCFSTRPVETFEVLNDLVVDRGPSPYVSLLEVFGDEHHMTTAQADGLCISTPTGSTAYSLSAGGSLVHPEIPAILITPICPHTLSFRPMQLPDSMELRIAVPYNSRSTAWASFDGRGRVELKQGDHIKVTASKYPFPTICAENQSKDWFESISRTLKWNERQRQKSFVVVEEGDEDEEKAKAKRMRRNSKASEAAAVAAAEQQASSAAKKSQDRQGGDCDDVEDDDDEDDEDQEEEAFDIDDTSTAATRASSPDPGKDRRPHHHRRHSSHGSASHPHRQSSGSSAGPSSAGSNHFLQKLQPLTSSISGKRAGGQESSETRVHPRRQPQEASGVSLDSSRAADAPAESGSHSQGQTIGSSGPAKSASYQHGVVQSSNRSLLDSPDRFGLAGPPEPPRAISERHLATADFRLDGGKEEDGGDDGAGTGKQGRTDAGEEKQKVRSQSNAKREASEPAEKASKKEGIETPLLDLEAKAESNSKGADRLYRKLRNKVKSERSANRDGTAANGDLDLTRNSSRGTGTALVVYGQDESDSDSTAEG